MNKYEKFLTPYASFTLFKGKKIGDNEIKWKGAINDTLLINGTWLLEVKCICLSNIKKRSKNEEEAREEVETDNTEESSEDNTKESGDNKTTTSTSIFKLTCNLLSNNFRWFSPIIQKFDQTQPYINCYPFEFFEINNLNQNTEKEHVIKFHNNLQKITLPCKEIEIEMKPVDNQYKFSDIQLNATVLINIYKA